MTEHFSYRGAPLPEYSIEPYEDALRPYADDEFLSQRLTSESRWLRRYPQVTEHIQYSLSHDDDESLINTIEAGSAARYHSAPPNEPPVNRLLSYVTYGLAVHDLKNRVVGVDAPTDRMNAITVFAARDVCDSFADSQLHEAISCVRYLRNRFAELDQITNDPLYGIADAKLWTLSTELRKRHRVSAYLDLLPYDEFVITPEDAAAHSAYINEGFASIRSTQQYGVKMGYLPQAEGGSLVFHPTIELSDTFLKHPNVHPLVHVFPSTAEVVISRKKHHKDVRLKEMDHGNALGLSVEALDSLAEMSIGPDGELYASPDLRIPVRDIALEKGKYTSYRSIHARILAYYFDLTHSLDVVHEAQRNTPPIPTGTSTRDPLSGFSELVIPRIYIAHGRQAIPPTSDHTRSVRRHNVTWHRRDLPDGWHASPAARALAKELGVTLEPGETIVKEHKRGSELLGKVTAYKLIYRPDK